MGGTLGVDERRMVPMNGSRQQWRLLVEHIGERMSVLLSDVSSTVADQTHGTGHHLRTAAGAHTSDDTHGAAGIDGTIVRSSLRSWVSAREEFGLLGVRDPMNPSPFSGIASNAEVAARLADLHNLEVTGFETRGVRVETVQQYADTLDSMRAIYPRVDIRAARIDTTPSGLLACAHTTAESGHGFTAEIVLDQRWAVDPQGLEAQIRAGVDQRLYVDGSQHFPLRSLIIHKFGHALYDNGPGVASKDVEEALIDHWLTIEPWDQDENIENLSARFLDWRAQLSGCSFRDDYAIVLDHPEATAEAFVDVVLNGENSSEAALPLFKLLDDNYSQGASS
ncbi:hypothetical protein [Nocardia brasiliensis]|uniref:hypothetical protein n=1 Tax=Nocardia brasiliensis TaxID=37326 RepID=UPI002456C9BF|nr:hypothetical protein [Nocardia brasiliensis]